MLGNGFDVTLALLDPPSLSQIASILRLLSDCETILDLGCGEGNHMPSGLPVGLNIVGADSHEASLVRALKKEVYADVICGDIFDVLARSSDSSYDAVIACDLIEHLPTVLGVRLASEMIRVRQKVAVIATPNGYVAQPPKPDNAANEHLSGWKPDDLARVGFNVSSGHYGWRPLRTTYGLPRLKPSMFGDLLASATARPIAHYPKFAYQLVAANRA